MRSSWLKSACLGALLALLVCVGYLLFGPLGLFGEPEAAWARVLFFPGIWAGWRMYEWSRAPQLLYMTVGIVTMMLCGALLNLAVHGIRTAASRLRTHQAQPSQAR